jgi:hypothetical protein
MVVDFSLYAATIKGTVTSREDHKPINPPCSVFVVGSKLGAFTDRSGQYAINGVPTGKYFVKFSALTFVSQTETVDVVDSNQIITCDVDLPVPLLETSLQIEDYQRKLAEENSTRPILTIQLDYMSFRDGFVTVHPSMRNCSKDLPFTVLRIVECLNPIEAIVKDSAGKIVRPNLVRIDCLGEKIYPDWYDQISIPEDRTIDYVPVILNNYDFRRLPEGRYSIALKYNHQVPHQLCCFSFEPDYREKYKVTIDVLLRTLRGEYVSTNTLTFVNKH